ncbi:cation:proton antiporter [Rubrolithibacter danxiaensis]|uniref:cation:proton antiporter n=1 Tax=Rubrolithibacter danxiaensis TaxID=3390805 RepID=UPI003BF890D3
MDAYELISFIIFLSALFAYINTRFIKWPPTIGIMAVTLIFSVLIVLSGNVYPRLYFNIIKNVSAINFQKVMLDILLSFLLFAGAIRINFSELKKVRIAVITLSSLGIIISTAIIGFFTWLLFQLFNFQIPFIYCLLFGALISPTDPIAVLGILKEARIPKSLELKIAGESLFNDGIAVVLFIGIAEIAQNGIEELSAGDVGWLFLREAGGGILFGFLLGYLGLWAIKTINDYKVEVFITLAIVMAGYSMARALHVSGPLAVVIAGIITGNKGKEIAMSDVTKDYLGKFWELIDEILNSILFLLIGLEMLLIKSYGILLLISTVCIVLVLLARYIAVSLPAFLLKAFVDVDHKTLAILTWGGLRGGVSVALALSLPRDMHHEEFVLITYTTVVFSILVQGLTVGKFARQLMKGKKQKA